MSKVVCEEGGSEIRLLAVALGARRSGVGRSLMLEAERIASMAGATTMTFSTQSSMIAAHGLYRSLDYQRLQVATTR